MTQISLVGSKVPHPPMEPQTAKPETNKPTEKPTEITSAAPKEPQPTGETLSGKNNIVIHIRKFLIGKRSKREQIFRVIVQWHF